MHHQPRNGHSRYRHTAASSNQPIHCHGHILRRLPAPITNRKVRFTLVGCGRIAASYFNPTRKHAGHRTGLCLRNRSQVPCSGSCRDRGQTVKEPDHPGQGHDGRRRYCDDTQLLASGSGDRDCGSPPIGLVTARPDCHIVWARFKVLVENRAKMQNQLQVVAVPTTALNPSSIKKHPAYQPLWCPDGTLNSRWAAQWMLGQQTSPDLPPETMTRVVNAIGTSHL